MTISLAATNLEAVRISHHHGQERKLISELSSNMKARVLFRQVLFWVSGTRRN